MSRREAWLSAAGIFGLALVVRVAAAGLVVFPIPEDTAYYVGVARNLVEGRGLVSDALWSYATPPLVFPRPAFEIWLPLPTLLIAPVMAAFGVSFRAAQAMPVFVGALVPVLAWRLAADVALERRLPPGRARTLALGAGVTACVELPLLLHSTLPDSTMLFTALAVAACIVMERALLGLVRPGSAPDASPGMDEERTISSLDARPIIDARPSIGATAADGAISRPPWAPPPADARGRISGLDAKLVALGVLLGLAALTRNEAIWLALTWVSVVVMERRASQKEVVPRREMPPGASGGSVGRNEAAPARPGPLRLIGVPALVAIAVFAPWALRDWLVFGSPFPGQALTNALFVTGHDVYAFLDPPTLSRYLAQGWQSILQAHVDGFVHNLLNVLLIPSFPVGLIGLVGLLAVPWTRIHRSAVLRPILILSVLTFTVTTLVFPVTTTWGTFLHASGPVQVLLLISCLIALDLFIARIGVLRGWTRPVAWLGPTLTVATACLFSLTIVAFGEQSAAVRDRYRALGPQLAALGATDGGTSPIITNYPIFLAEGVRTRTLGLPDEPPANVLELARRFGARYLTITGSWGEWPAVIDHPTVGDAAATCFREVTSPPPKDPADAAALADTRIWEVACP